MDYHKQGCVPGGARRNFTSYGEYLDIPEGFTRDLLCDPQTSGGLLVSVEKESIDAVKEILHANSLPINIIGQILAHKEGDSIIALK
jgi:selenide,water dikinase